MASDLANQQSRTAAASPAHWPMVDRRVDMSRFDQAMIMSMGGAFVSSLDSTTTFGRTPVRTLSGTTAALWIGIAAVAIGALSLIPLGPNVCQASTLPLSLGPQVDATMTVRGRTPCQIGIPMGTASIQGFEITTRPQNGILTQRGRTGVVYQAVTGYRGTDKFEFTVSGRMGSYEGTSVVRVTVTVK
jgi:hypothetical protein